MSKLVLSRKAGQSILIGDQVLEVLQVDRSNVHLRIAGRTLQRIPLMGVMPISAEADVRVTAIQKGSVRLCFDAPPAVKIIRTELLP